MEGKKFEIHQSKKFEIEDLNDSTPLSDIEPIEEGGVNVRAREDLRSCVELPLLEACELLFDKGVPTIFSSANRKDIGVGHAHIALDYEMLSPENKVIADKLGKEGIIHGSRPRKGIYLEIPVNAHSTLGEIKERGLALANEFEDQNI